jgi:hypothetical protein
MIHAGSKNVPQIKVLGIRQQHSRLANPLRMDTNSHMRGTITLPHLRATPKGALGGFDCAIKP